MGKLADARLRHAQFYLDMLRELSQQYAAGGDNIPGSLGLLTQEWDQLVQGQAAAAEYAVENNFDGLVICSDYPNAGAELLGWKQHPNEHIRWQREALAAAEKLGVSEVAVVYLNNLGNASFDLGEYQQAVDYLEQALHVAQNSDNRSGEGSVFGSLGRVFSEVGEYQEAIEFYNQSLEIFQELQDEANQLLALGSLGIAYKSIGDYAKAMDYYEEAQKLAVETGDIRSQGKLAGNLGILFAMTGDLDQAVRYFEEDLAIAEKLADTRGIGQTLNCFGLIDFRIYPYR
jgi:tetratricopeptide (TPR) repeat protein